MGRICREYIHSTMWFFCFSILSKAFSRSRPERAKKAIVILKKKPNKHVHVNRKCFKMYIRYNINKYSHFSNILKHMMFLLFQLKRFNNTFQLFCRLYVKGYKDWILCYKNLNKIWKSHCIISAVLYYCLNLCQVLVVKLHCTYKSF